MPSHSDSSGHSSTNGPTTPCCQTSKPPGGASSSTSPRSTILSGSTRPSTTSRPTSSKPITPRLLRCETPPRSPEVVGYRQICEPRNGGGERQATAVPGLPVRDPGGAASAGQLVEGKKAARPQPTPTSRRLGSRIW